VSGWRLQSKTRLSAEEVVFAELAKEGGLGWAIGRLNVLAIATNFMTVKEPRVARGHLLPLDGVRGLAILMVMGCHAFESNYERASPVVRFIGEFLHYGIVGVDLFFVLSGFLITGILYDSLKDDGYFRKFYARRVLRIFPLYYGVLAVCFLLTRPLHLHWGAMGWLLVLYLQNLQPAAIVKFAPGASIALYHFWSLAVEEQFYLVWPAVVLLVSTKRGLLRTTLIGSAGALLLRLVLVVSGSSPLAIHVTTICRADSLLLGGALALLYRSPSWARVMKWAPWGFAGATTVAVVMLGFVEPRMSGHPMGYLIWSEGFEYTFLAVASAGLIAWSLQRGSLCSRVFEMRPLRFLGKYSYGIYVLHVLVLTLMNLQLRAVLLEATHNKLVAVVGAGLASLAVSIVVAYLSYHLYERPFLRLKHYFDYARPTLNHGSPEDAVVVKTVPAGGEALGG
jgi:peptidoglycan/LPS O-acetylase OafA/YrhL